VSQETFDRLPFILLAALATAVVSFLLTPLAIRLAPRLGAVDHPQDDRRVHSDPIPRTGGLAVAISFVGVGVLGLALNEVFHFAPVVLREVRYPQLVALFAGAGLGAFLGYLDDRLQLRVELLKHLLRPANHFLNALKGPQRGAV
jgi:UDP-N-acetylmuramyl pentapeptide phosphotransferase/UDP-N-acetylglucosamine-1-phosphate transferase